MTTPNDTITFTNEKILAIRHIDPTHKLNDILAKVFKRKTYALEQQTGQPYLWNADFYGLDKVSAFKQANFDLQEELLVAMSQSFLREACSIEHFGFSYASKIMMLSDTVEEKSIFAMFVSDETRHLRDVLRFVDFELGEQYYNDPYMILLADIIREGDKQSLIFLLQAMLEGHGIQHYRMLLDGCQNEEFSLCIRRILKDEAYHHATGLALVDEKQMTPYTKSFLIDCISRTVQLLSYPHRVIYFLERGLGGFSKEQTYKTLNELNFDQEIAAKIQRVKALIYKSAPQDVIEQLERLNVFKTFTADDYRNRLVPQAEYF